MIKEIISKVVEGKDLTREQAVAAMNEIMDGEATAAQIGSFLTAMRLKGETVDEITGFATVMREKASRIKCKSENVVDTCGTGGDCLHTFSISTIASLVAAGAGVSIAKHGNRSVSSRCVSADVFKALGVNIEADVPVVERCINEVGIGFLFAPLLHKAMKYAIGPRREMGIRTVFNILGPMTNPAGAKSQLLGVYDASLTELIANVLKNLGSDRVFVVYGEDGQDEISITGPTKVTELREGNVETYTIKPEDFGIKPGTLDDLKGGDTDFNCKIVREILSGKKGPKRDAVLLNSAAAIAAAGLAENIAEGIQLAADSIDSGKAKKKLEDLIAVSNS